MRVEGVRIKEVFQNVMDLAIVGANKVMADVATDAKRLCPTKKGVSVGTVYRPYGRVMKDVLFTTKRGKDVNFIADTEMGRTAGNLRATIRKVEKDSRPGNIRVYCGNKAVWYSCIYDGRTTIKTPTGFKTIGSMKEGDFVIGQDGMPHEVLSKSSFPAKQKPNLVRLTVEWRSGLNHTLTVTDDHKILTIKDGVSFWVRAGEMEEGDYVFCPKKISPDKGKGKKRVCVNCQKEFTRQDSQGKKYCSVQCRDEYWVKGNNPHIGSKRTESSKRLMHEVTTARMVARPETHPNRIMAQRGYQTNFEKQVEEWIGLTGLQYECQFKVGNHFVDFAIPEKKMLIEADGAFWHSNQTADIERDKEIMDILPGWDIVHVHFTDRRFSKSIDPCPLPGVRYMQCNNSMNSFVNMSYFEARKIIKKEVVDASDSGISLYDLSIKDVHSFVAKGIVVSNSFVEYGTSHSRKQPFMRPAFHAIKGTAQARIEAEMRKEPEMKV
jgi:very-short-patch-repair endonuclease